VVHFSDGVEGTLKRIKAAQQFVAAFGVATECGFGRRPPDTMPALLRIHSQVAEPVSGQVFNRMYQRDEKRPSALGSHLGG
jgi:hypothetical protein